jgi:hypothetical protein
MRFEVHIPQPCDYVVEVQTGDVFGAGTAAKVFISIFGEHGTTGVGGWWCIGMTYL